MSAKDRFKAGFVASVDGAALMFPHLSAPSIIDPPHAWFDAALARQLVIHLMVHRFEIPKRRIVEQLGRSREAVNRALATIDARKADPHFRIAYGHCADQAERIYNHIAEIVPVSPTARQGATPPDSVAPTPLPDARSSHTGA